MLVTVSRTMYAQRPRDAEIRAQVESLLALYEAPPADGGAGERVDLAGFWVVGGQELQRASELEG